MAYQWLAAATMVAHFAFLAYVVAGGFLAWWRPCLIWPHVVAVGWGFATVALGLDCPLTYVEDWARRKAGEQGLSRGFIDTYLTGVVYPERYTLLLQVLAGLVVLTSWVGFLLRRRAARDRA
ncbi:DUF2784 domain-containing protein [Catellatospora citrea]|uniref:DUF2784 domain-containing protein n=1 Tax=Catellatospora citrea TaxID=53366 RepID=A0A8J3KQ78_9ACTN|nr:DUF2784 domain-containing protein [Catellatospora citrea]RKE07751.1 uncharacterized protein DUF2784 [Catellatospora citrea]GIF99339.1 hypothetical protein Cci01nite_44330 [Catellatospora citrea]